MFTPIRWSVIGLGLVFSLSFLADDVFAQRGKGGGRGGGGGGHISHGGGGRGSFGGGGGAHSFGRSGGDRSSFGRSGGGGLSIRRGGGTVRSFGRGGDSRGSFGSDSPSFRGFGSRPRIGRDSARSFGRDDLLRGRGDLGERSGSFFDQGRRIERSQDDIDRRRSLEDRSERRRDDFGDVRRSIQGRRDDGSVRRFEGRRDGFGRGDLERGGRGDRDRFDRDRFRDRDRRDHDFDDHFRHGRSYAGRFLRFYRRPYRSFGIYFGWPYYYDYDYGYGYGYGGYYDRYYFDYRSPYYLDAYLGLGCYHYSYNPTIVYPAPTNYVAVVPDSSIPVDEDKQFSGDELLALGEDAFYARDYKQAVRWLRHAAIELPDDPKVLMLLSQALFATGDYGEAAGAAQAGMLVAEHADQWDVIIGNYREYYSDTQDYVDQLKALESYVFKQHPDDLAARFLVGLQYGLLGYPKQSVRELDNLLKQAPEDRLAREFRRRMAEQLGLTEPVPEPTRPETLSQPDQPSQSAPPSEPETDRERGAQEAPPPSAPDNQARSSPELPALSGAGETATP